MNEQGVEQILTPAHSTLKKFNQSNAPSSNHFKNYSFINLPMRNLAINDVFPENPLENKHFNQTAVNRRNQSAVKLLNPGSKPPSSGD